MATASAQENVLVKSVEMPSDSIKVKGYDFNQGVDHNALFDSFLSSGFQATNFGLAVEEIKRMRDWRLSDEPVAEDEADESKDPKVRAETKATIFLGYTSNMASCGVRETIRFLCQHKMVDCIVATAGGIEEDFIKCIAPTYLGSGSTLHPGASDGFSLDGKTLRLQGLNRIGNMLVPNENYCKFEEWMMPLLDKMTDESVASGVPWTPSTMIHRLGLEINNEESIYYWCAKNNIPVFSPALTDGSIGDMLFFHSYKKEGFILDLVGDIRKINMLAMKVCMPLHPIQTLLQKSNCLPTQSSRPPSESMPLLRLWPHEYFLSSARLDHDLSVADGRPQAKHTGATIIGGGVVRHINPKPQTGKAHGSYHHRRGGGQAPHHERKPHAQRCRPLRPHQHWAGDESMP